MSITASTTQPVGPAPSADTRAAGTETATEAARTETATEAAGTATATEAAGAAARQAVTPGGPELRRHRRARATWPARLLNKSGSIVNAMVCDVSEGGVGLLGSTQLPLGTVIDITLSVPDPDPKQAGRTHAVRARVRVVFSSFVGSQCRLGVQFLDLPMASRIAIRRYVFARS